MNLNTALDCTVGYRKETHGIIVPLSGPKFGIHLIPFRTWEEYESYMRSLLPKAGLILVLKSGTEPSPRRNIMINFEMNGTHP